MPLFLEVERAEEAFGSHSHHHEAGVKPGQVPQGRHDEKKGRKERHELAHREQTSLRLVHGGREHDGHRRHA